MANKKLLTIVNGERVIIDSNATDLSLKSVFVDGVQIKKAASANEIDLGNTKLNGVAAGVADDQAVNAKQLSDTSNAILGIVADTRGYKVDYITIDPSQASAKEVQLGGFPTKPERTLLDVIGGGAQMYSEDFTVADDKLSWSGLGLDSILGEGDKIRIVWF